MVESGLSLNILVVCDLWTPHNGGLHRANQKLCTALSSNGHQVTCAVTEADPADYSNAATCGVKLVIPTLLGRRDLRAPVHGERPFDVVVGHDRLTGPAAAFQAKNVTPTSLFVLMVHSCPDEAGPFTSVDGWTGQVAAKFDDLRELCAIADLVCVMGPLLERKVRTMVHDGLRRHGQVVRIDPGPDPSRLLGAREPAPDAVGLFLGRAAAAEMKGLDIAAKAFALVAKRSRQLPEPILWVRGAPQGRGDEVYEDLVAGRGRRNVVVRDYSCSGTDVEADLRRASVLLMPSRAEAFGLVGVEALELGTPVLLSSCSGLAELVKEKLGPDADGSIVKVDDDPSDISRWADALEAVLADRQHAFARTAELTRRFSKICNWPSAAEVLCSAIRAYSP